jgi:hypothetical protein
MTIRMAIESMDDLQDRQILLQLIHSGVGDACIAQVDEGDFKQSLQMRQPSVGDFRTCEIRTERLVSPFGRTKTGISGRRRRASTGRRGRHLDEPNHRALIS